MAKEDMIEVDTTNLNKEQVVEKKEHNNYRQKKSIPSLTYLDDEIINLYKIYIVCCLLSNMG